VEDSKQGALPGGRVFEFVEVSRRRMATRTMPSARPVELAGRGSTVAYEMAGPPGAPTLLLLHGLGASGPLNWFPAFGPLSDHFRVVAMDLRGHGRGIPAGPRYRLADCADDAAALADALDIERFIPVGYSLGGPIAQLLWHRHRERVDGLVLCATSRNFSGKITERLFFKGMWGPVAAVRASRLVKTRRARPAKRTTPLDAERAQDLAIVNMTTWAFGELGRCKPADAIGAAHALGRFSSHEWCGEIDVPTAVVVTLRDRLVSPSRQFKLAHAIPGATIHEVDSDHAACVLGARVFVPALVEACDSVAERAAGAPSMRR
jgi:3-oxoadipate enol-lactonase